MPSSCNRWLGALVVMVLIWSGMPLALASDDSSAATSGYTPPLRGSPKKLISGGTRGDNPATVTVAALAPSDHVGLTVSESPRLYWYAELPNDGTLEFTLIEVNAIDPLLELTVPATSGESIGMIALAEHSVRLSEGVEYQWFVSVIVDGEQRSLDVVSEARIERIAPGDAALGDAVASDNDDARASAYARNGIWYDALQIVSDKVAKEGDGDWRDRHDALLRDVGLEKVANAQVSITN